MSISIAEYEKIESINNSTSEVVSEKINDEIKILINKLINNIIIEISDKSDFYDNLKAREKNSEKEASNSRNNSPMPEFTISSNLEYFLQDNQGFAKFEVDDSILNENDAIFSEVSKVDYDRKDILSEEELQIINQQIAQAESDNYKYANESIGDILAATSTEITFLEANELLIENPDYVYQCNVCFDDYIITEIVVLNCGHYLCLNDMVSYIESKIKDGKSANIKCLQDGCGKEIVYSEILRILSQVNLELWEKYQILLLKSCLESDPNVKWCPKPDCGFAVVLVSNETMLSCRACNFQYCSNCKEMWHNGLTCEQNQRLKLQIGNPEYEFIKWCINVTRLCPVCKVRIEKSYGCDHMICTICHSNFNWSNASESDVYPTEIEIKKFRAKSGVIH